MCARMLAGDAQDLPAKKKPAAKKPAKQAGKRKPAAKEQASIAVVEAEAVPETRNAKGQFLPGTCPNPSGRGKGVVNVSTRMRSSLMQAGSDGVIAIDAIVAGLTKAILKDPGKYWEILKWIEEREYGKTPLAILLQDQQEQGPKVIDHNNIERAKALDDYLQGLESPQRSATVSMLADIERAIPNFLGFE